MLVFQIIKVHCLQLCLCFDFAEELGSNFGDKTLGNSTTDHQILVPTLATLSLSEKSIKPLPVDAAPFSEAEAKALLRKVI